MKLTQNEWLSAFENRVTEREYDLLVRAYDVLRENTIQSDNALWGKDAVISPWSGWDAGIWNWDSAFHAMTVSRFDTVLARNCINCFLKFQLPNGMLPDVIFADGRVVDNFSKPPVMATAALAVFEAEKDMDFLKGCYEKLVAYEGFWANERCDRGLFYYSAESEPEKNDYLHPRYESGWDNSPRWDKCIVDQWAIDLNCFMVMYYRAMSKMAEHLGLSSEIWKAKETELSALIETTMFDEAAGAYVDRDRKKGEFNDVLSPASFMPLYIGIASKEHALAMSRIATDKKKFYPGMPTVSYDCPAYSTDYWRGNTWLNVAYFAIKGLKEYGFNEIADGMRAFLLEMIYDNREGGIYENYDTVNRKGMYCNRFSWSAAFVIEFILNY